MQRKLYVENKEGERDGEKERGSFQPKLSMAKTWLKLRVR